jgi:DNA polymerase
MPVTLPREERLKVLGLWPVWRLRAGTPEAPAAAGVPAPAPLTTAMPTADIAGMDWQALREAVGGCTRCDLHKTRTQGVFGVGDVKADWLIVGEAPGADEDRLGEPFVGQAGKLLDAMLAALGLGRGENVFIANVLKSRPPGNRDPKPEEVVACLPFLERQIDLIRPKIILALGRFAAQSLLLSEASISRLRGRVHDYRGVPLVVTYHPAYLLRNLPDKAKAWEDLCLARAVLAGHGEGATASLGLGGDPD